MKKTERVGISELSKRKIYHRLVERSNGLGPIFQRAACLPDVLSFIDKQMTVREAEEGGYRLCLHCRRKTEKGK